MPAYPFPSVQVRYIHQCVLFMQSLVRMIKVNLNSKQYGNVSFICMFYVGGSKQQTTDNLKYYKPDMLL